MDDQNAPMAIRFGKNKTLPAQELFRVNYWYIVYLSVHTFHFRRRFLDSAISTFAPIDHCQSKETSVHSQDHDHENTIQY